MSVSGRISAVGENGKYLFVRPEGGTPADDRFVFHTSLDRAITDPQVRTGARVTYTPIEGRPDRKTGKLKGNGLAAVDVVIL